ncbi:MAG: HEAT repeat domain-containing protein [Verrucomicrobia bacterium]|nr:HEAT repeat domain-containing protein [Verrucomicrobiota bacterium]
MKTQLLKFPLALALAMLFGCSSSPKIDIQAQLTRFKTGDQVAREEALVEIAKAGPKAEPAMPTLVEALKDKDALIRRLALHALGEIGPKAKSALPAIKALMNDTDQQVLLQIPATLQNIDPKTEGAEKFPNVQTPPPQ